MTHTVRMIALVLGSLLVTGFAQAFDQQHSRWDALVKKHVVWINDGVASQVNYRGFQQDQVELQAYLDSLSAVSEATFKSWTKPQQLAFLINAYNAFTVQLILTEYPQLQSIKDLGSFLRSPWKKAFFTLFGAQHHLDYIEHDLIRAPGVYDEPRIHVAVVCASIGCPALHTEAYIADKLDAQLEQGMRRFMADRSRNRYNATTGQLEVSKIFDWYGDDFTQGHGGFNSVASVFARYADLLSDDAQQQARIRNGEVKIIFLDYDWALNDYS